MPRSGSIGSATKQIRRLEGGECRDAAYADLWGRFSAILTRHARNKLRAMRVPRGAADEDDLAQQAFWKICRAIEGGKFQLATRLDLHRLLIRETTRQALNLARRARRDAGDGDGPRVLEGLTDREASPEFAFLAEETLREMLRALDDEEGEADRRGQEIRLAVVLKLLGHTNEEIRHRFGCTLQRVERRLEAARSRLAKYAPGRVAVSGPRDAGGPPKEAEDPGGTTELLDDLAGRS